MGGYFRESRRNFGVVTLLLACASMCGLLRSTVIVDVAGFPLGRRRESMFASTNQAICVLHHTRSDEGDNWRYYGQTPSTTIQGLFEPIEHDWFWCRFGGFKKQAPAPCTAQVEPYWSLVLPFTSLSAWLLMSKRHQPSLTDKQAES